MPDIELYLNQLQLRKFKAKKAFQMTAKQIEAKDITLTLIRINLNEGAYKKLKNALLKGNSYRFIPANYKSSLTNNSDTIKPDESMVLLKRQLDDLKGKTKLIPKTKKIKEEIRPVETRPDTAYLKQAEKDRVKRENESVRIINENDRLEKERIRKEANSKRQQELARKVRERLERIEEKEREREENERLKREAKRELREREIENLQYKNLEKNELKLTKKYLNQQSKEQNKLKKKMEGLINQERNFVNNCVKKHKQQAISNGITGEDNIKEECLKIEFDNNILTKMKYDKIFDEYEDCQKKQIEGNKVIKETIEEKHKLEQLLGIPESQKKKKKNYGPVPESKESDNINMDLPLIAEDNTIQIEGKTDTPEIAEAKATKAAEIKETKADKAAKARETKAANAAKAREAKATKAAKAREAKAARAAEIEETRAAEKELQDKAESKQSKPLTKGAIAAALAAAKREETAKQRKEREAQKAAEKAEKAAKKAEKENEIYFREQRIISKSKDNVQPLIPPKQAAQINDDTSILNEFDPFTGDPLNEVSATGLGRHHGKTFYTMNSTIIGGMVPMRLSHRELEESARKVRSGEGIMSYGSGILAYGKGIRPYGSGIRPYGS